MDKTKKAIERYFKSGSMKDSYVDYLVHEYFTDWLMKRFKFTLEELEEYMY